MCSLWHCTADKIKKNIYILLWWSEGWIYLNNLYITIHFVSLWHSHQEYTFTLLLFQITCKIELQSWWQIIFITEKNLDTAKHKWNHLIVNNSCYELSDPKQLRKPSDINICYYTFAWTQEELNLSNQSMQYTVSIGEGIRFIVLYPLKCSHDLPPLAGTVHTETISIPRGIFQSNWQHIAHTL